MKSIEFTPSNEFINDLAKIGGECIAAGTDRASLFFDAGNEKTLRVEIQFFPEDLKDNKDEG